MLNRAGKIAADVIIGDVYERMTLAAEVLSAFWDSVHQPLNVTYGDADDGYIKVRAAGYVYVRDVYIRDVIDRIPGYAYYQWATTEQTRFQQVYRINLPVRQRTATTYEYEIVASASDVHEAMTPGFEGSISFYIKVISMYNITHDYFTYEEDIQTHAIMATLLS